MSPVGAGGRGWAQVAESLPGRRGEGRDHVPVPRAGPAPGDLHVADEGAPLLLPNRAGVELGGLLPACERRGRVPRPVRGRHGTRTCWGRRAPPTSGTARPPSGSSASVPEARILIMLRDPVDRAYSHYWNDVREGIGEAILPRCPRRGAAVRAGRMGRFLPVHRLWAVRGPGGEVPGPVRLRGVLVSFSRGLRHGQGGHDGGHPFVPGRGAGARGCPAAPDELHLAAPEQAGRGAARQRQGAQARSGHGSTTSARQAARSPAGGGEPAPDGPRGAERCSGRSTVPRSRGWPSCSAGLRRGKPWWRAGHCPARRGS